ncbi:MAG: hypothetical protein P8O91_10910 [Luminiphilus sp.]|nr:hypothetical protein [Luminiphilus sp.]
MKGQQSPKWLLSLLMVSCVVTAQDAALIPVNVPESLDPNEGSGWLRIELAVLVDDRTEVIASEAWPPYPATQYPNSHRRLEDAQLLTALSGQYPQTEVIAEPDGSITLLIPDPQQIVAKAKADALAAKQQELTKNMGPTMGGRDDIPTTADEASPAVKSVENPEPIALEMINAPDRPANAGAEWLSPFNETSPAEAPDDSALSPEAGLVFGMEDTVEPATPLPVLPNGFTVRPVQLLSEGLRQLTRSNPDRLELSTAWLQAPEVANLPIVLDNSGDEPEWPQLQGFVQIRTGDTLKVGVNFWWNTQASYLPEGFYMTAPPMAPPQRLWRDQTSLLPLPSTTVAKRQTTFKAIETHIAAGLPLIEFVDPTTGFFRELAPETNDLNNFSPPETWPWRHFIHVADTRSVSEGSIRYFDHPVLKIIATWQELTWGEVYQIGAEDHEREELEAAIQEAKSAADDSTPPPVSQVPPDKQSLR